MVTRDDPRRFLPLKPDALYVLLVVAREPCHGYGIIRDVEERSGGEVRLQTGALYRLLKRLLAEGLIEEVVPRGTDPADERRRYYRATRLGGAVLAAEVERMERLVRASRAVAAGRRPRLA
ncbi:MAG TPA: PadR family transcriptional regulator [Gemmatimonadaceae bacterium]|nr:PadR family transcriptional regulator [Gemmatimonadaceae bacterium]